MALRSIEEVEVELYRVSAEDWPAFRDWLRARPTRGDRSSDLPGVPVHSQRVQAPDDG